MNAKRKIHPLMAWGLVALAAAGMFRLTHWHGDAADAVNGFLYGVSIGLMLLGIYRTKHRNICA